MDPIVNVLMKKYGKTEAEAKAILAEYQNKPWATEVMKNLQKEAAAQQETDINNLSALYDSLGIKDSKAIINQRLGLTSPSTASPMLNRQIGPLQALASPPSPSQPRPSVLNWQNFGSGRPIPSNIPVYGNPSGTGGSDTADLGGQ